MNQLITDFFTRSVTSVDNPVFAVRSFARQRKLFFIIFAFIKLYAEVCLLYTSDAADE